MAKNILDGVVQHVRQLAAVQTSRELADRELLDRFVGAKDEAAFTALVQRHGSLVLGVCYRALKNEQDAEDACQATFLVLARDAAFIRQATSLCSWLHGVASRVAANLKRERLRRCRRERHGHRPAPADPAVEVSWREAQVALDEELHRLPERYRTPLVLCYLDGRTRDEAARQLGVSVGCLQGRLDRGRQRLRDQLSRRGISLSAALLATALGDGVSQAALSPTVVLSTVKAGIRFGSTPTPDPGLVPTRVVSLAGEVLRNMSLAKRKVVTILVLVVGAAVAGAGVLTGLIATAMQPGHQGRGEAPAEQPQGARPPRADRWGDPLPAGALARMGTLRFRHGAELSSVAFAHDGKVLASADFYHRICLWDASTGQEIRRLNHAATCIAFSPDGRTVASGDRNNVVRLWDVAAGKERGQLAGHRDDVLCVAFSPDGKTLASAGGVNGHDLSIRLWDVASGRHLDQLTGHTGPIQSIAFSPDGRLLASASNDRTVRLWDVARGKESGRLNGHHGAVHSVAFSPDGKTLASGGRDKTLRLWDVAAGKERHRCGPHQNGVQALAFAPDGKLVASGSGGLDQTIRLWDVATGQQRGRLETHGPVASLAFSPDGKTLLCGGMDATLQLWDVASRKQLHANAGHQTWVTALAESPDGRVLASAGRVIRLWDSATGKELRRLAGHQGWVGAVRFSPDGTTLASAGNDKTVRLWQVATGKPLRQFGPLACPVWEVAFSADGKLVAAAGQDGAVRVWQATTGQTARQLQVVQGKPAVLAFAADGKRLAVADSNDRVHLWDLSSGKKLTSLDAGQVSVSRLAFSADSRRLVAGGINALVCVWDVTTGKELGRLKQQSSVGALAISPDGKQGGTLAVSLLGDPALHLWDVATGKETRHLSGHRGWVQVLAFSANGRTLYSGGRDTTVLAWDLAGRMGSDRGRPDGANVHRTNPALEAKGRPAPVQSVRQRQATGVVETPKDVVAALARLPRRLAKQPTYRSRPKYCLLVFGAAAQTRVWLVLDGNTLYVDRTGNSDLTEAGKKVSMPRFQKIDNPAFVEQREVKAGEIQDGRLTHTNLEITQMRVRAGFAPKTHEEAWLKASAGALRDGFAYMVSVKVARHSPQGKRLGRVKELAWADEGGLLHFADHPKDAPVVHFDGPLRMGLLPGQALVRGARPATLNGCLGTPGLGKGTFATLVYTTQPGLVPEDSHPLAEITFPAKAPGGAPVRARITLSQRC
jgi:RNA polymerase sigma factor (sigma-70 family)